MSKIMRIALVAPLEESIPPRGYGGTELVVHNLAETLVEAGHEVFLLATADSQTRAHLIPIYPRAIRTLPLARDMAARNAIKARGMKLAVEKLQSLDKVDLVHNHAGWKFLPFSRKLSVPFLSTVHSPLYADCEQMIYNSFRGENYVTVSNSQRELFRDLNCLGTVYNGIDVRQFSFVATPGEYLVFLGRITPKKGPALAIEIAKRTGKQLLIAAKVDPFDQPYFESKIRPLLDGKQIVFLGEVGSAQRDQLLKHAYALLSPIQWEEPFGLVMVEAMACGTPVIVTNMGAAAEVVAHGETGYVLPNRLEDFVTAVAMVENINRYLCRRRVEQNFTKELMTKNYLRIYEQLLIT